MADGIASSLASFTFKQIMLINEVQGEFEKLQKTLSMVKALLLDAEEQKDQTNAAQHRIQVLKHLLLGADDIIDNFLTEDMRKQSLQKSGGCLGEVCDFLSSSFFRLVMSYKIKDIKERFDDVKKDILDWNSIETLISKKAGDKIDRETDSYVLASDIIGRDETRKDIINLLMQPHNNSNVSSVAIVGIGGLGKTAVAQLVYNDDEIANFFQKKMWVCVSEDFEPKLLVKRILQSMTGENGGDESLDQLGTKLRRNIDGQRYFLVLDDVWNEKHEKWSVLRKFLMGGAEGSKILVTTRSKRVAETMEIDFPYDLQGLGKEESWSLFEKMAYKDDTRKRMPLVKIGKEIARKCRGVPLAIRTVASLLRSRTEESYWSNISEDVGRLLKHSEDIMPILKLSYYKLPIELRQCFAYCAIYPKDHRIYKQELIQLWMAQGYLVKSFEKECLEDVGAQYVDDLLLKSFFQDAERDKLQNVKSFKIHDLIHDLAQLVAGSECYIYSKPEKVTGTPVHVSCESDIVNVKDMLHLKWLRSFVLRVRDSEWPLAADDSNCIPEFASLRVLDMSKPAVLSSGVTYMHQLPNSFGELKHLRYLNLAGNANLKKLPESICDLINLQTLKLDHCWELQSLPQGIGKLINLRYLTTNRCDQLSYMPVGFGNLKNLQGLSRFILAKEPQNCAKLNELDGLINLRGKVCIERLGSVTNVESESQGANLEKKDFLRSLTLDWSLPYGYSDEDEPDSKMDADVDVALQILENLKPHPNLQELKVLHYPGFGFPIWMSSLISLVRLKLNYLENCQHLPPLNQLPSLEYLRIDGMSNLEHILYVCNEITDIGSHTRIFFPRLKHLEICKCDNLRGWKRLKDVTGTDLLLNEKDHKMSLPPFPCLSSLTVYECPKLTSMPLYPSLEEELYLTGASLKPFMETVMMNRTHRVIVAENHPVPSTSTGYSSLTVPYFAPLSKLKSVLFLGRYGDAESIPDEGMKDFISLESLRVYDFPALASLSRQFQYLTALKKLCIGDDNADTSMEWQALGNLKSLQELSLVRCKSLRNLPDCICNLPSLRQIEIFGCTNFSSFPEGMCSLTSLQNLELGAMQNLTTLLDWVGKNLPSLPSLAIQGFSGTEPLPSGLRGLKKLWRLRIERSRDLETIPEWIGELTSLREISITECWLKSLPEGMRQLTNLQRLTIRQCPFLRHRCWTEGEDWNKIKHVPDITVL